MNDFTPNSTYTARMTTMAICDCTAGLLIAGIDRRDDPRHQANGGNQRKGHRGVHHVPPGLRVAGREREHEEQGTEHCRNQRGNAGGSCADIADHSEQHQQNPGNACH